MSFLMRCPILENEPAPLSANERVRALFVSAEVILLFAAGEENPDGLQQHGVWHQKIFLDPWHTCFLFVCFSMHSAETAQVAGYQFWQFLPSPPEPKVVITKKQCFSLLILIKGRFATAAPCWFHCVAMWAVFYWFVWPTIELDVKNKSDRLAVTQFSVCQPLLTSNINELYLTKVLLLATCPQGRKQMEIRT